MAEKKGFEVLNKFKLFELVVNHENRQINCIVGRQGCPNSTDCDLFTLIWVKERDIFTKELMLVIEETVVSHVQKLLGRDDVETNIVFGNEEHQVVIWSNKGSADGSNLIHQTYSYWHNGECMLKKAQRWGINGLFETFSKITLSLLKTGSYSDAN